MTYKFLWLLIPVLIYNDLVAQNNTMNNLFKWHKEPFLVLDKGYIAHVTHDGYAFIVNNRKYGLIDFDGNMVVDLISDEPLVKKGLIPVKQGRDIGLINLKGDTIYPCKGMSYKFIHPGFHLLSVGREELLFREDGSQLKTEYPIRMFNDHEFKDGAISVEVWLPDGSTGGGYIDTAGNSLMEFKYRYNDDFEDGIAAVRSLDYMKNSYIDKKGNTVFECPVDWITVNSFDGPLALIQIKDTKGFAFIDRNYKVVVEPQFGACKGRHNGLYIVSKDGKYGAIDSTGKTIIPFEYSDVKEFTADKMIVGKIFFKKQYKNPAQLWSYENTYTKTGVFDLTNHTLSIPLEYENLESAGNGRLIAKSNGKFGYLNEHGKPMTGFDFDHAQEFHNNRAWVQMNGKWGIIELP